MSAHSPSNAEARASTRLGQSVGGKYKLRSVLGIGGMSTVYAASHRNGLSVAIKLLHDDLASDESVRRWFLREAYLANRVNHRGAVRVLDDDVTEDGAAYLVIERLYGDTLRAVWERAGRKLPPQAVALFAYDVLDVLSAAHARGIIHRDIKPENLFLTDDGDVKVLDFGIAHPLPVIGEAAATTTLRVAGTPAYMAPEQARGSAARAETDVWGVGATMFSLITGEYVHGGAPPPDLLEWAAGRPARAVGELARDLPSEVAAVIDRALAFEPEQRFATAQAMRDALGQAFASAFGGSPGDARGGILAELQSLEPIVGRAGRRSDVHSVATQAPELASDQQQSALRAPTERLPSGTTRPGAIERSLVAASTSAPPRWRQVLRGSRAFAGAATIALLGTAVWARHSLGTNISRQPEEGARPDAAAKFGAAVQLWRDASVDEALHRLDEATDLDPSFAKAHLRYALWAGISPATRDHFHQAAQFRERLSTSDLALFNALEPSLRDPFDAVETRRRLERSLQNTPDDTELLLALASRYINALDGAKALPYADHALAVAHNSLAIASFYRARGLAKLGRFAEARTEYDRCFATSPSATGCISWRARIDANNDGRCDSVEDLGRRLIAIDNESAEGHHLLAGALFAQSQSVIAAHAALEPWWLSLRDARGEWIRRRDETFLNVLAGDFSAADKSLLSWEHASATFPDADHRGEPAAFRLLLDLELGRNDEVGLLAHRYLEESLGWSQGIAVVFDIEALRALYFSGGLSKHEFDAARRDWLSRTEQRQQVDLEPSFFQWYEAYVEPVRDADDARLALQQRPPGLQNFDQEVLSAQANEKFGRLFYLAGDSEAALDYLRKSATACSFTHPLHQTTAIYYYGEALERTGDTNSACAEYAKVTRRWGKEPRSITASAALVRSQQLHCTQSH